MKNKDAYRENEEETNVQDAEVTLAEENHEDVSKPEEERSLVKNLVSVLIIIFGLFLGSIFVDIVQLASGEGVSRMALSNSDVFEVGDRTWVAYDEPMARVSVLTDEDCESCDPSQALIFLRRYLPTLLAEEVSVDSRQGQALIEQADVRTLPAFVFDESVEETTFYVQASQIFVSDEEEALHTLDIAQLGLPVGRYLSLPSVDEEDIVIGPENAPVTIVEYSDFQCPYCRLMHPTIQQALTEFDDQIRFVYKHLPLSFHLQAENAALASECADEQDSFMEYADVLFENQEGWGETEGTAAFKQYAVNIGLDATQFNQCLDSQKYLDKVVADTAEAEEFGVSGTPGTFVGSQFIGGAAQYASFKRAIEEELAGSQENAEEESEDDGEVGESV